jgi:hypothetical protein
MSMHTAAGATAHATVAVALKRWALRSMSGESHEVSAEVLARLHAHAELAQAHGRSCFGRKGQRAMTDESCGRRVAEEPAHRRAHI